MNVFSTTKALCIEILDKCCWQTFLTKKTLHELSNKRNCYASVWLSSAVKGSIMHYKRQKAGEEEGRLERKSAGW